MYDHVDSTSAVALRLVQSGVKGNYVIFSKQQTEGKSGYGNEWFSPEGNFFLSLLLEPTFTIQSGAELSFVTSLAIRDAIISVLGVNYLDISFKWPNTILLNGKKIGGILLESSSTPQKNIPNWFIVGIGINLMHYQEGTDFPSTSLKHEGFGEIPSNLLLNAFMENFSNRYNIWRNRGFAILKLEWLKSAFNINKPITVLFKGQKLTGVFEGIDDVGTLLMRLEDGQCQKVIAGEVFFEPRF
jgi:BirA family biotin operon repressor/biotin-[acetyl-CoA-carboxylase] ligase